MNMRASRRLVVATLLTMGAIGPAGSLTPAAMAQSGPSSPATGRASSEPTSLAPCAVPPVASYEGEDAQLSEAQPSTEVPGYEGSGYAASSAIDGGSVAFAVSAPSSNFYTLRLRYGNGAGAPASRKLSVDGQPEPKTVVFQHRYTWSEWTTVDVTVHLGAGDHNIGFDFTTGNQGLVNLDSLALIACTSPTDRSSTSQLFNNWNDLVGIAHAAQLYPKDVMPYGPSLAELHYKGDWPVNQIQSEAAYFSGLSSAPQSTPPSWNSTLAFDRGGVLHQDYLDEKGIAQPIKVDKSYVAVPGQSFIIATYDLHNLTSEERSFNFMDHVELNNKQVTPGTQPGEGGGSSGGGGGGSGAAGNQIATWNAAHNGFNVDMTGSGQFYFSSGAFQAPASHGAGSYIAGPNSPGNPFQTVVSDFNANGSLSNNDSFTGSVISVGVQQGVSLPANGSTSLSFVYTVQGSADAASSAVSAALGKSASSWADQQRHTYADWLAEGNRSTQPDTGVGEAWDVSLVTLKQSQQPEFGSWVAATNPAYEYKVWPRDASVTAMAMDAAGHTEEAGKYYHWMASVQVTDFPANSGLSPGTWYTNYGFWQAKQPIPFVQPELDSTGLFIVGVFKHYAALVVDDPAAANAFIQSPDISDAVTRGANFIIDGIDPNLGFGPQDFSIWEERIEFATFTQVTYAAGLRAAASVATLLGNGTNAAMWSMGGEIIRDAILRPTNTPGRPGLWYDPTAPGNPPAGCIATGTFHGPNCNAPYPSTGDPEPYFARGIFSSGGETPNNDPPVTVDAEVDSSTGLLWVLGVISPDDPKAVAQQAKILKWLGNGAYGISRHENDEFYYSSVYSPGGQYESSQPNPIWPQPVMYMSMLDTWQGNSGLATTRLQYFASVTASGYEPPGEAVDPSNLLPLISTTSEPVTGAWFLLAGLVAQGQYDPRMWPEP